MFAVVDKSDAEASFQLLQMDGLDSRFTVGT
jgi:hypothetical protein